ncbi:glycosyltransferase family 2 protein [Candidatus Margulisiibacteriota bacterium]
MKVSVVIPVHNRKDFVLEAIDSVLAQTHMDLEIIVVDDGSDPEHRTLNTEHRTLGDKFKYYYRSHRGVAAARNFGVSVASGKYIAFLDSDDLWDKKKLEKQINYLQKHPDFKICHTDEKWLRRGEHLNQLKKHRKYHGRIFDKCLPLCIISASSIIMEKEIFQDLGGFDESLPVCEDYDLWLRMALRYPVAYLNEKLVVKRGGHADQLSQKYWGMDRFRIRALEKLLRGDLSQEQKDMVRQELKNKYCVLLLGSWKRKKYLRWLFYKLRSIIALK